MELDFNSLIDGYQNYEEKYLSILEKTIKYFQYSFDPVVSVSFVDKETIHQINKEYRHVDKETDVISFAFLDDENDKVKIFNSKELTVLGDIYICVDVAIEHAKEYGHSLDRELNFLFVHGLLHLLGYDHMKKEDEDIMFPLQEVILGL